MQSLGAEMAVSAELRSSARRTEVGLEAQGTGHRPSDAGAGDARGEWHRHGACGQHRPLEGWITYRLCHMACGDGGVLRSRPYSD